MSNPFQIATLSPGLFRPSIPIAARRAGGLGILDFEYVTDREAAVQAVRQLESLVGGSFGVRLGANAEELLQPMLAAAPEFLRTAILTPTASHNFPAIVDFLSAHRVAALLEATNLEQARIAVLAGFDGVIAKGHEAGGRVADETTFILLQRFRAEITLPIWAQGGIGLHTAPACAAAGAAGIILDAQLALARESALPESVKGKIASMDGSETICLGEQLGETFRMYFRPGNTVIKDLQAIEANLAHSGRAPEECLAEWRKAIHSKAGWESEHNAWMLGQDAAFAAPLAKRFRTVGGILHGLREAVRMHIEQAVRLHPLAEGSPLAKAHGTRYPIMQGPMTRVSDVPEFAAHVAEGGGLPFLALALMRGPEVRTLLEQAQRRMGTMPWGVGVLGFVPQELRQEQMEVITEFKPPFALIAGGRPDQAGFLEKQGIITYLHVPSPGLLEMFVKQGARRFVFEGRECGGHVGPRTSFVLWNQMVDVLLGSQELQAKPEDFHIVFAAGIHDALSAAAVSVVSAPLAALGVKVGALIGSAYLFTKEAVSSGAILGTFQEQAQLCAETVLLETGPGHSTRCVATPFANAFFQEKRRLAQAGHSPEEIRMTLEDLNLGRLRIASKGLTRNANYGEQPSAPKLLQMEAEDQLAQGMYMIGQVAALRNSICTIEDLHRDISVEGSNRLNSLEHHFEGSSHRVETPSDVAVIGMSCVLPKAPDAHSYWQNILNKVDAITEVPLERWNPELYYDADPKAKDKIYSRWGGFLDDVAFDPMQYGMPPSTLRSIEPSQLLTLEVVRAALQDSGYLDRQFARERTSVILGAGGGAADLGLAYGARSFLPNLENLPEFEGRSKEIIEQMGNRLPEWTEDSFAGILTNVSAGRVANRFDLGGSNYTVDAACASSLAAVSLALKELEGHTSDMVIVGGIDTMQNPFTYLCFSKTHALSPRGRCRTFDESADGIAISEGIAVMVFKRLEDAERDGDRIYAVIKGSGSSSDGKDRGLTAPRPEGQARALRRAYAKAGFSPATVGLIEAHGTGTVAGDGAEVQALTQVFSEFGAERQGCAIGSVKSMIGHTKCSAGAAGLMKAALALHHKVLPPTLGVQKPNPRARFAESPFYINTEPRPWLQRGENGEPRRAGVSAFGFGGTNFHIVLEEYTGDPSTARQDPYQSWPEELFLWKSDSREDLSHKLQVWEEAISVKDLRANLRDLAHTAWKQSGEKLSGASSKPLRLAIVASSIEDLRQKVASARESLTKGGDCNDPRGIYFSERPFAQESKLAFLFPGQGSQYPHMLENLLIHFPEMRPVFERATQVLKGKLERPLTSYVFPTSSFSREEEQEKQKAITQTNVAQPALGAAGIAMFRLLKEFGIHPDMLAGHSYGEYVALAAAGIFDEETLIALSEARGRFIVEAAVGDAGTMAAVEAGPADVAEVLRDFPDVCVANANAPKQTVVSGATKSVGQVVERFNAKGITARGIPVACAFHSPLVAAAQARLSDFLAGVSLTHASTKVFSNTTAAPYPEEPQRVAALLVDHLVKPVEFSREIESMYAAGARVFVEVGPRSVLTGLVERILENRPKLAVASNQSARPALTQILHLLGQLAAQGVPVNLDRLFRGRAVERLNLAALPAGEPVLSPSVWLVNGARAKPLKETQTPQAAPEAPKRSVAPPAPSVALTNTIPAMSSMAGQHAFPLPEVPFSAVSGSLDGVPQVMAQFQQMMARFLESQQAIMLTYLGSTNLSTNGSASVAVAVPNGNGHGAVPAPVHSTAAFQNGSSNGVSHAPMELIHIPQAPTQPVMAATAAVAAAPAKSGPDLPEITGRLLAIVSDRTGYPLEMLDLNLDLEADLGIDSIKRVEILGTFQQSFASEETSLGEGIMEKLSGVRTLQGIVERVAEQLGGQESHPLPAIPVSDPTVSVVNPSAAKEEVTSHLLAIVSDRTGYPTEMLGLDLDLEADLGIDSIKRVEILGTFQQSFSAMGLNGQEGLLERLSGVRTLRGILDQIGSEGAEPERSIQGTAPAQMSAAPASSLPSPSTASSHLEGEDRIGRFTLAAIETEWEGHEEKLAIPKNRTILITDDGRGIAQALAALLVKQGHSVSLASQRDTVEELGERRYGADFTSPAQAADLIETVRQKQGPLGGLIHLLPLSTGWGPSPVDQEAWSRRLQLGAKSLFYLAKAARVQLHESATQGGACLMSATAMGGSFLSDLPQGAVVENPDHGGVVGLVKTLALEWPEVRVKAVDLNIHESASALADHLWKELSGGDSDPEVGRTEGKRIVLQPIRTPSGSRVHSTLSLDPSSVLLITGGARGIAARAAQHFAQRYRPTIVLIGRSPLPDIAEDPCTVGLTAPKEIKAALMDRARRRGGAVTPARVEQGYAQLIAEREVRGNLAALNQTGARVQYNSVDVRDSQALGNLIDQIYGSLGRIDGVIHAAGVIEDKLIQDKNPDSFDRVFDTKVQSAFTLSKKLRPESLQFLVFFSSVSGRFGNRGQGDYAAANEVLNKLAVSLDRAWPSRVVAINWGPWDNGGMVSAEVREQFAKRGVELISPAVGLLCLEEELKFGCKGEAEIVVGGAGWLSPADNAASRAFPLLGQAVVSGEGDVWEIYRDLDPALDLYLNDHKIDGQPVLPLAIAAELMAEAVSQTWPSMKVRALRDLRLLNGVVLENGPKTIRIVARKQAAATPGAANVAVEITTATKPHRAYYRGVVEIAERGTATVPHDNLPLAPAPLSDGRAFTMSIPDLYRKWLFHGPLFQGILAVESVGPSGIRAILASSRPADLIAGAPKGRWFSDPLVFDSALQLLLLWGRQHWDMTALPSGFLRYRFLAEPTGEKVLCELRLRSNTGQQNIHADIYFIDPVTNQTLSVLEDMQGACSKALNRLANREAVAVAGKQS